MSLLTLEDGRSNRVISREIIQHRPLKARSEEGVGRFQEPRFSASHRLGGIGASICLQLQCGRRLSGEHLRDSETYKQRRKEGGNHEHATRRM